MSPSRLKPQGDGCRCRLDAELGSRFDAQDRMPIVTSAAARRAAGRTAAHFDRGGDRRSAGSGIRWRAACASASIGFGASGPADAICIAGNVGLTAADQIAPTGLGGRALNELQGVSRHGRQGCDQRVRADRPARGARGTGQPGERAGAGRDQRPGRRQGERAAVQARQRSRHLPGHGRGGPTATT